MRINIAKKSVHTIYPSRIYYAYRPQWLMCAT